MIKEVIICDQCGGVKIKQLGILLDKKMYEFPGYDFCCVNCFIRYAAQNQSGLLATMANKNFEKIEGENENIDSL